MRTEKQQHSKIFLAVATFATAFSLLTAGCSSQDPLAGQSDSIRNGVPPSEKGSEVGDPTDADILTVRAPDKIVFAETQEGKIVISGAMSEPVNGKDPVQGQDFELLITNLEDFDQAKFDAVTGEFQWTPPKGFTEQNYAALVYLDVTVATTRRPVLSKSVKIPMTVTRSASLPEILEINFENSGPYREGETVYFTVKVRDRVARNVKEAPLLTVTRGESNKDISQYVRRKTSTWDEDSLETPKVDPKDASVYIYKMEIYLVQAEVTRSKEKFEFGLFATNRFAESSTSETKQVEIITSVREPSVSWTDTVTVVKGQENTINFTVYDPFNESALTTTFEKCVGGATACVCVAKKQGGEACSITFKPAVDAKSGIVKQLISVSQRSKVDGDIALPKNYKFTLWMDVVDAPAPETSRAGEAR